MIDEWKTDGSGHEITKVVRAGGSYVLRESKAPDGYEKAADMKFSVTDDRYILYGSTISTSLTMVDQKIKETEKKNKQSGSGSTISGNGSTAGGSGSTGGGGSKSGGSGSATGGGGSVKTGDNTPVLPWMFTGILSLMVIAFILIFNKKRSMTD